MKPSPLVCDDVLIPAGTFLKGITDAQGDQLLKYHAAVFPNMKPQKEIYLDAYRIDRYPVTNQQFLEFVLQTGYRPQGRTGYGVWMDHFHDGEADLPVVAVSWTDMNRYAAWAGKRLPTEAEWEKAARGIDGRLYPWGDEFGPARCNMKESGINARTPVDRYDRGKSPFGCFDMTGNVWEIVTDWWELGGGETDNYLASGQSRNPNGPRGGLAKVMKGGAYSTIFGNGACPFRISHDSSTRWDRVGFRCARSNDAAN